MKCGIGIRPELFAPVFESLPNVGFLEAHSENYFGQSIARARLLELREHYSVSLHGVGLSLGRADNLNQSHLRQLKELIDDIDPLFVSEHLAWSAYSHRHLPDLLPLPLSDNALSVMCEHVDQMQSYLGRQVLVENPSNYLVFNQLQIPEPEFLNALAQKTGCGLLVDVNNVHVSASNIGLDAKEYIDGLNTESIAQYHLAGYTEVTRQVGETSETLLIDTHNQTVFDPVWQLFSHTLEQHGARPSLFEWDSDYPEFDVILAECQKADLLMSAANPKTVRGQSHLANERKLISENALSAGLAKEQVLFLDDLLSLKSKHALASKAHQHRMGVYQNNVFAALQSYLADVFPATRGVLGADYFKQLAQSFIQSTPPSEGNIYEYGASLSSIVTQFDALDGMAYLSDLMAFEWALHAAYFASASDSLDVSSLSQQELLNAQITFNPSIALFKTDYPIYEIHRQSLPDFSGEVLIDLNQSQDCLLVYRSGFDVVSAVINDEQFTFLENVQKKQNLLQAIEDLQGSLSADTMSSTLALMLDNGMLSTQQDLI